MFSSISLSGYADGLELGGSGAAVPGETAEQGAGLRDEGPALGESVVYDPQPTTMAEVQEWIDVGEAAYSEAFASGDFSAALAALVAAKPHWQYKVAAALMPPGYRNELVTGDGDFGADYYTWFVGNEPASIEIVADYASLLAAVKNPAIDVIEITGDIQLGDHNGPLEDVLPVTRSINFVSNTGADVILWSAMSNRHMKVTGGDITLGFSGVVLERNTTAPNATNRGGIDTSAESLTLENAIIRNCRTTTNGGAIYVNSGKTLYINDCTISGNNANYGGGIYGYVSSTITVTGSKIENNTVNVSGGGIYSNGNSTITVTDSNIKNNTANDNGGGVFIGDYGTIAVTGSEISGNKATSGSGGGIYSRNLPQLTTENVIFAANTAASPRDWTLGTDGFSLLHHSNIINTTYSAPFTNAYNNYDISYSAARVYVEYYLNDLNAVTSLGNPLGTESFECVLGTAADMALEANLGPDWINLHKPDGYHDGQVWDPIPDTITENIYVMIYYLLDGGTTSLRVKYDPGEGSGTMTDSTLYTIDTPVNVLPNAFTPPEGKRFAGFTLKAAYTVTYHNNDDMFGVGSFMAAADENGDYTILSPEATGIRNLGNDMRWDFACWNTEPDGSGTKYMPGDEIELTESLVLYARWKSREPLLPTYFTEGSSSVYGSWGIPGSTITVTFQDGTVVTTTVSSTAWSVEVPTGCTLVAGDSVIAYQTEVNKEDSDSVSCPVWGRMRSLSLPEAEAGSVARSLPTAEFAPLSSPRSGPPLYAHSNDSIAGAAQNFVITGHSTLTAQWVPINDPPDPTFKVTYNANGGTGSHEDAGLASGSTYTVLPLGDTGISRSGYAFTGWNTAADGSGTAYAAGAQLVVTRSVTLYAQWKATILTYAVTYNANGGTGSREDPGLAFGSTYTVLSLGDTGISRSGYAFTGWNTATDGSGTAYLAGAQLTIAGNVTLFAQWMRIPTGGGDSGGGGGSVTPDTDRPSNNTGGGGPAGGGNPNTRDFTPVGNQPVPLSELPFTDIFDDDVPLVRLPDTGNGRNQIGFLAALMLGGAYVVGEFVVRRRKKAR